MYPAATFTDALFVVIFCIVVSVPEHVKADPPAVSAVHAAIRGIDPHHHTVPASPNFV